ncbi:hypothetical protein MCOR12_009981 [Pyricularia oryzae]|nr:hypothetical protein MCOR12_009981 [Pyricularia oryzae]KAI6594536.1 hypothetical protein MCOR06_003266 [Pyricularia oryzae]
MDSKRSTKTKHHEGHPSPSTGDANWTISVLIHAALAFAYVGTDQGSWSFAFYALLLGLMSHVKNGLWCGFSMAASVYMLSQLRPVDDTYYHYYLPIPLFALGTFGWTRVSLVAVVVGIVVFYTANVEAIYALVFFAYGYLLSGYRLACAFAALFWTYWLGGWTPTTLVAVAILYAYLAGDYLSRADSVAALRLERKDEQDQARAELEDLDPGNQLTREFAARREDGECSIRQARKDAAEGNVLLAGFYNKRVFDCEYRALSDSDDGYWKMVKEVVRVKNKQ